MANTYLSVEQDNTSIFPVYCSTSNDKELNCSKCALIALGIIILIGSLVASAFLLSHIGAWSFAVGGSGLIGGSILIAAGLCCDCKTSSQSHTQEQSLPLNKEKAKSFMRSSHQTSVVNSAGRDAVGQSIQIPTRASDIHLPATLPETIPSEFLDISGEKCLNGLYLQRYTAYLATKSSSIVALNTLQRACRPGDESIDSLHEFIFNYLPSQFGNLNSLNLPIPLLVSGNHWALVFIDRERRTVEYYDSKMDYGNQNEIVQKLTAIAEELSRQEPNQPHYKFVRKINKVLQLDGYQCGPWILYFLESRLIDSEFDFNQLDIQEAQELIKKYRIKIMQELVEWEPSYLQQERSLKATINEQNCKKFHIARDGNTLLKDNP